MTLPVLTFHSLDEIGMVTSCPPAVFARGLEALARHGFQTLDLETIAAHLEQRRPFPERSLALTFDDGHASVYEQALPVLQRLGMKATVFLTVGDAATGGGSRSRLPSTSEGSLTTPSPAEPLRIKAASIFSSPAAITMRSIFQTG